MNRRQLNRLLNIIPVSSVHFGSPRNIKTTAKYCAQHTGEDLKLFNIEKADYLNDLPPFYSACRLADQFQLFVARLTKARVWGRNGAVITATDTFLEDVSYEFTGKENNDHSILYTTKQKSITEYSGCGAVISHPGADVYYHWMIDILPRIGLIEAFYDLEGIDFIVCDYTERPFQKDTLNLLGIEEKKIVRSNNNWDFHARFDQLIVPSLAGFHDQPNLYQVDFLRNLFKDYFNPEPPTKKIFLSRKTAGRRHIINEAELLAEISGCGYEIIYCEDLNVFQQVKLFSEALVVMGPHGSAFTNIIFCKKQTVVIDIVNSSQVNPCFWIISQLCRLDYRNIFGESVPIDNNYKNDNILIDMEVFRSCFRNLNKRPATD